MQKFLDVRFEFGRTGKDIKNELLQVAAVENNLTMKTCDLFYKPQSISAI